MQAMYLPLDAGTSAPMCSPTENSPDSEPSQDFQSTLPLKMSSQTARFLKLSSNGPSPKSQTRSSKTSTSIAIKAPRIGGVATYVTRLLFCLSTSSASSLFSSLDLKGLTINDQFRVDEKIAIVTGAASGIGKASVQILSERGAKVVASDRDGANLEKAVNEFKSQGLEVSAVVCDMSNPDSIRNLVSETKKMHGRVDIGVNSAGITGPLGKKAHEVDLADFDLTISINLRGAFVLSQELFKEMVPNKWGRIVHVASIAGKEGNPNMAPYNASKSGLIGIVKGMGKEYADTGVTINAVAPAVIRTNMITDQPDEVLQYMINKIPMGRVGEPEEVAQTIAFACSPACSFTTGFVFDSSGGRTVY